MPVSFLHQFLPKNTFLSGAHLNQGLMCFQLNDQITRVELVTNTAMPFEDTDLLHISNETGDGYLVDH